MILQVSGARVTEVANFLVHVVASTVECRVYLCRHLLNIGPTTQNPKLPKSCTVDLGNPPTTPKPGTSPTEDNRAARSGDLQTPCRSRVGASERFSCCNLIGVWERAYRVSSLLPGVNKLEGLSGNEAFGLGSWGGLSSFLRVAPFFKAEGGKWLRIL